MSQQPQQGGLHVAYIYAQCGCCSVHTCMHDVHTSLLPTNTLCVHCTLLSCVPSLLGQCSCCAGSNGCAGRSIGSRCSGSSGELSSIWLTETMDRNFAVARLAFCSNCDPRTHNMISFYHICVCCLLLLPPPYIFVCRASRWPSCCSSVRGQMLPLTCS